MEAEKREFASLVQRLTNELEAAHRSIMQKHAKEQELNQQIMDLLRDIDSKDALIRQQADELTRLNAQVYKMHLEFENVLSNFRTEMKEKAIHERGGSGEFIARYVSKAT